MFDPHEPHHSGAEVLAAPPQTIRNGEFGRWIPLFEVRTEGVRVALEFLRNVLQDGDSFLHGQRLEM